MRELSYTLLTDGSSDQVLIPILTWLLRKQGVKTPIQSEWADPRRFPKADGSLSLSERIKLSVELYPCQLLFIHRDAEREGYPIRLNEIELAVEQSGIEEAFTIGVVPVRMQEAWLLFDEKALRFAAGNPNGQIPLDLPPLKVVESVPDPKNILHGLLREASGLSGRRRKKFRVNTAARRVAEFIDDFSPLCKLSAFQALERHVQRMVRSQGWDNKTLNLC